jgi:hypothetical protein
MRTGMVFHLDNGKVKTSLQDEVSERVVNCSLYQEGLHRTAKTAEVCCGPCVKVTQLDQEL